MSAWVKGEQELRLDALCRSIGASYELHADKTKPRCTTIRLQVVLIDGRKFGIERTMSIREESLSEVSIRSFITEGLCEQMVVFLEPPK